MAERKRVVKQRRKERKNVPSGHVHIQASFNNTIITITDPTGAVISWGSAGIAGFKGSRKSTPYAAALSADGAARRAMEHGMRQVEVYVKGPGAGREQAIRSLQPATVDFGQSLAGIAVNRRRATDHRRARDIEVGASGDAVRGRDDVDREALRIESHRSLRRHYPDQVPEGRRRCSRPLSPVPRAPLWGEYRTAYGSSSAPRPSSWA